MCADAICPCLRWTRTLTARLLRSDCANGAPIVCPRRVRGSAFRLSRDRRSLAPFPVRGGRAGRVGAGVLPPVCPLAGPDAGLGGRARPDPRDLPGARDPPARAREGVARAGPPRPAGGAAALRGRAHAGRGVRGPSRDHVPDRPGLGSASGGGAVDRGGRGGGDRPALCVHGRADPRGMGREGGRRSGAPLPLRCALGRSPRRADGVRAGGAVRADPHRRAPGAVRAGEPRGRPRGLPALRARRERVCVRPRLRRTQRPGAGAAARRRAQAPQPGRGGGRRCGLRLLRRAGSAPRRRRAELRGMAVRARRRRGAWAGAPPRGRRRPRRIAPERGGVPRPAAGRRPGVRARLPLRARR